MWWQLAAKSVLSSRDSLGTERWSPATAVQHGRSLMVVAVEAGDAPSDSIDVTVVDGVLTARGVDPDRGAFLEAWKLPEDADVGKLTATVACGYLVITVAGSRSASIPWRVDRARNVADSLQIRGDMGRERRRARDRIPQR